MKTPPSRPEVGLRPHHWLCLLAYRGLGYSPDFCACFDQVAVEVRAGAWVRVVTGMDILCQSLTDPNRHCTRASVARRDALALDALETLLAPTWQAAHRNGRCAFPYAQALPQLRTAYARGTIRAACTGCEWQSLCDTVAQENFRSTRLRGDVV